MRRIPLLVTLAAVALTACSTETVVPEIEPGTASPIGTERATASDDEFEGEGRDPDALFGADVCTALLPALDGNLEGLDRYATDEILAFLDSATSEPMAEFAEVYDLESDTGNGCTIVLGDWWVDLTLLGDGHVGERAIEYEEHSSYEDEAAFGQAIEDAVVAYRASAEACGGDAADLNGGQTHLTFGLDGGIVVAVVCDNFAYQSTFDLRGWDDESQTLTDLTVEQWVEPDGIQITPLLLGYPYLEDDGSLVNLAKDRGVGDCGTWQQWFLDGDFLGLTQARVRSCDEDGEYVEPHEWPRVHPIGD